MELNLTLGASDLAKTKQFYRDVLCLSPQFFSGDSSDAYLIVSFKNIKVVFQPLPVLESRHPALLQNLARSTLGVGMQLELSCPNLAEVECLLNYYHWPIIYELDDQEHQRRELWVQDPDGYLLVLNQDEVIQSAG